MIVFSRDLEASIGCHVRPPVYKKIKSLVSEKSN